MRPSLWRVILAGILGGIALFILPFVFIRIVLFFLLIGFVFRVLFGGRWRRRRFYERGHHAWQHPYPYKEPLNQSNDII